MDRGKKVMLMSFMYIIIFQQESSAFFLFASLLKIFIVFSKDKKYLRRLLCKIFSSLVALIFILLFKSVCVGEGLEPEDRVKRGISLELLHNDK